MISADLLLRYFAIAQRRLQQLSTSDDLNDYTLVGASSLPLDSLLSRHRLRIVEAQLAALDEALAERQGHGENDGAVATMGLSNDVSHNSMREALQQIGSGDYSCVSFPCTMNNHREVVVGATVQPSGLRSRSSKVGSISNHSPRLGTSCEPIEERSESRDLRELLAEAVEQTNELARQAFARSVLIVEWRNYHDINNIEKKHPPQSRRDLKDAHDGNIDDGSILEYFGMMMAAVQLSEVQQFLRHGSMDFLRSTHADNSLTQGFYGSSADNRLLQIQRLYWRALGWDPRHGTEQLNRLVSFGCTTCSNNDYPVNAKVLETVEQYASAMIVAVTNASIINTGSEIYPSELTDDGTTRVVSVSYSEKIMNLPRDAPDSDCIHPSLSAPTCNTINEHASTQQRSELNAAKATAILQQQIWDEFQLLDPREQMDTVEEATRAHNDFLEKVASTPPGAERIQLIQSMDDGMQRLLMIYKLWSSRIASAGD
jgi:hypothetical protein